MTEKEEKSAMTPEWRRERAELLETIKRQQEDAERLAKRFKLLQRTLVDQQELLDRYQHALQQQSGALAQSNKGNAGGASKGGSLSTADTECAAIAAAAGSGASATTAVSAKSKPRGPAFDEHRALTAANTARNATSSLLIPSRQATQDTKEFAIAASTSMCAMKKRKSTEASFQEETQLPSMKRDIDDDTDNRRTRKRSIPKEESRASVSSPRKRVAINADATPTDSAKKPASILSSAATRSNTKPSTDIVTPSASSSKNDSASWICRKADFHRASGVLQSDVKPELSTSTVLPTSTTAHEKAQAMVVDDVKKSTITTTYMKKRNLNERAPTWAQEKLRMQEAGIIIKTGKRRFSDLKPLSTVAAANAKSAASVSKGEASSQSGNEKESAFQYVEVVRNRDARAALPGHDCVECRKYYEALDGLIPDADVQLAKAKCSRHRARFEPYNTPDDFWRLSFPDSEPQPLSP